MINRKLLGSLLLAVGFLAVNLESLQAGTTSLSFTKVSTSASGANVTCASAPKTKSGSGYAEFKIDLKVDQQSAANTAGKIKINWTESMSIINKGVATANSSVSVKVVDAKGDTVASQPTVIYTSTGKIEKSVEISGSVSSSYTIKATLSSSASCNGSTSFSSQASTTGSVTQLPMPTLSY